jgi:hypothetical protein
MESLQSTSPGAFSWSPTIQHNNLPTPIHHDSLDDNVHHDPAGAQQNTLDADYSRYTNPFVAGLSAMNSSHGPRQSFTDSIMANAEPTPHVSAMVKEPFPASRRPRSEDLDWDKNRQTLYRLYIQEDRTLTETMRIMKQDHKFDAS